MASIVWGVYVIFRLVLGSVDFLTDVLQAVSLIDLGHVYWGILTWSFPLVAVLLSLLSTWISKCRSGEPSSCKLFAFTTFKYLVTLFEGLFESGPELILQTIVVFHGVHLEDLEILDLESARWTWPWIRGVLHILSIVFSFSSLIVTLIYFNGERIKRCGMGDNVKVLIALAVNISAVLFRTFIASIMFSLAPWTSLGLLLILIVLNFTVLLFLNLDVETSSLAAYVSLFAPSGYSKTQGSAKVAPKVIGNFWAKKSTKNDSEDVEANSNNQNPESISEVERAKINQENLLKSVKVTHISFLLQSVLLLAPYITLLELYHYPSLNNDNANDVRIIGALSHRCVLYTVPIVLLVISSGMLITFIIRVRQTRDAAAHWYSITPYRNRTPMKKTMPGSRVEEIEPIRLDLNQDINPSDEASDITIMCTDPLPSSSYRQPPFNPDFISDQERDLLKPGNNKCSRNDKCTTCPFVIVGSNFQSMVTGKKYKFMKPVTCDTKCVIYLVTCARCRKQYVGKTIQSLKERHGGHRREIEYKNTPLGVHFAGSCIYTRHWRFQVIDHDDDIEALKRKEGFWQRELNSLKPWGLNTRDESNGIQNKK